MYRKISMQEILYVIRQLRKGTAIKKIARMCGMSNNTVRKYRNMAECHKYKEFEESELETIAISIYRELYVKESGLSDEMVLVNCHREMIKVMLKDKTSVTKIHQILSRPEERFSYSTLRRYVIREFGSSQKGTIRLPDTDPGSGGCF